MDYSSMPNETSADPPHVSPPPDPPDQLPPAPHPRRHTRYSTPNTAAPHVVINTRRRRSPHFRSAPHTAMSTSPPALQGSSNSSTLIDPLPQPPATSGQNHDRMETDEESEHDESDGDGDGQREAGEVILHGPNGVNPTPPIEDIVLVMDTTPDQALAAAEGPQGTAVDQGSQTNPAIDGTSVSGLLAMPLPDGWPPTVSQNAQGELQLIVSDSMLDSGILRQELDDASRLIPSTISARPTARDRQENGRQPGRREDRGNDDDEGSDSDESMDEGDHPYWAHFKPDTSVPDENEISAIEEGEEHSGTDHEYWEKSTFEPLDDPEYVASDGGRISWRVEGNHGTPEMPNREEIMRSPSVLIGGLYWNIKYYPRGNDGTDYMSVYIECSPKPYVEPAKGEEPGPTEVAEEKIPVEDVNTSAEQVESITDTVPEATADQLSASHGIAEVDMDASLVLPPNQDKEMEEEDDSDGEVLWSVAAQISCVVYNPAEPRTYAQQKSKHQYYNDNPDWGWTRFHGPWSDIHCRRRYQRKPLLENDTLGFTVYIQVIQDQTKSLWWHPSESQPTWDSMSLLGLPGLKCREHHSSAVVAAVSSWMHLMSLVERICSFKIPKRLTKTGEQLLPALSGFQKLLTMECFQVETADVSLSPLSQVISFFYGTELDSRKDVVMVWDALRRILNLEAALSHKHDSEDIKIDLFSSVAMLMQPDPFNPDLTTNKTMRFPADPHSDSDTVSASEPASVQEVIQSAFRDPGKAFRLWDSPPAMADMPAILQIELHRQAYDKDARKWKKLSHKIALDETVDCNNHEYTLYGMIVHCGGLDYHEYYSVLRPDGPGTRWLKYAAETSSSRSLEILTTKQAIANHEGGESEKESAAVAYVVIYVRSDLVSQVLSSPRRKDILQEVQFRSEAIAQEDFSLERLPKATPFRVGKRDWCAAFEAGGIYESIRGNGHLSRSFYRTEGSDSALRQSHAAQTQAKEAAEKVEIPSQANGQSTEESNFTIESKSAEELQKAKSEEPPVPLITVFVKEFDAAQQCLVERGAYQANSATNVTAFLRDQLKIDKDETWSFYHEHTIHIKSKHLIKRSSLFFDLAYGDEPWDGILIIAQRQPTAAEIENLEAAGKCVNPVDHSSYLLGDHNPIYYGTHLTSSHFTHPYLSVPLSYGRAHGQGTHISLSGSVYTGPYRCGRKSGPNGTMHYAHGDTYTGDWDHDEPNGQGTMVYAKTGNVFTGGWKKRLRHGKGVMKYNVADQEQMLCGVCYEKNMDSVFCFCGHVVACEECARKLDTCPVCREPVKRVMLLKGIFGGGNTPHEWAGGKEGGGDIGMIP